MYTQLGSNKDYRSQKNPIKVDKNNIASNYQKALNQSNYQNIYQASLLNKDKNPQQKKNLISPNRGANSNKLLKVPKNNELVVHYNFNISKDKEDSNERYYETNDNQENNLQMSVNDRDQEGQSKPQFFSPQNLISNMNNLIESQEKNSQFAKNKHSPLKQETQCSSTNNYTINDDDSKLQIKELIDMCPEVKNNENYNMNETLSFIHNRSSFNNSNFNPAISNIFTNQKILNDMEYNQKKNNELPVESFRKKNVKYEEPKQNNIIENNYFLKNLQNNSKNSQILTKITPNLNQEFIQKKHNDHNENEYPRSTINII